MDIWEDNKYKVVQLDATVSKRASKWILVCGTCQQERIGTYCQAWNIIRKKCGDKCRHCFTRNLEGLKKGRIQHYSRNRYNDKMWSSLSYVNFWGKGFVTDAGRAKQRQAKLGKIEEQANNWQGGRQTERQLVQARDEYKQFRKHIFARDKYKCTNCGQAGALELHHILAWSRYPLLRMDEYNCVTLCNTCHRKTDNYAGKAMKGQKYA